MKHIYFAKHGETDYNLKGLRQGCRNNIPLNSNGIEQAYYLGKYLKDYRENDIKFDLVVSSPLIRAKLTAEIVCEILEIKDTNFQILDYLTEIDHGEIDSGLSYQEMIINPKFKNFIDLMDKNKLILDPIENDKFWNEQNINKIVKIYGGENTQMYLSRCTKIINFLKNTTAKKILVVSHSGFLNEVYKIIINIDCSIKCNNKFGNNCTLTYFENYKDNFKLIYGPSTLFFGVYNKDYSRIICDTTKFIDVYNKDLKIIEKISIDQFKIDSKYILISNQELYDLTIKNIDNIKKIIKKNKNKKYIHLSTYEIRNISETFNIYGSWLNKNNTPQIYYNPIGLWISCGSSWIDYISQNNDINQWTLATYIYNIEINNTVLNINDLKKFKNFIKKYKNDETILTITNIINWKKLKNDYDGLIICPYFGNSIFGKEANKFQIFTESENSINSYFEKLLGKKWKKNFMVLSEWYRHWETATGVIWKSSGIKNINLINKTDTFSNYYN